MFAQLYPAVQTADFFSLKFRKEQEENVLVFLAAAGSVAACVFIMGDQCLDTYHTFLYYY